MLVVKRRGFSRNIRECGAAFPEYILLVALVAVALGAIGGTMNSASASLNAKMQCAMGGGTMSIIRTIVNRDGGIVRIVVAPYCSYDNS